MTYKKLPDDVGLWYSDDGQKDVFINKCSDGFTACWPGFLPSVCCSSVDSLVESCGIRPARWCKAERPEFPPLPAKPLLCYTRTIANKQIEAWRLIDQGAALRTEPGCCRIPLSKVEVIPHPDNDPAAVALIEAARGEHRKERSKV